MQDWGPIRERQAADLVDQVQDLVERGDLAGLADLSTSSGEAAQLVAAAMAELAHWSADVAAQENGGSPVDPDDSLLGEAAAVVAASLAAELSVSAGRAALRVVGTGITAAQVADEVAGYLGDLSDAGAQRQIGGALHGAVNAARIATFRDGPVGSLYAHEVNDRNTCVPCSHVNGRFLGTTDSIETVFLSYPDGAYGGYVLCLGGPACRGTIFGVWRQGSEQ